MKFDAIIIGAGPSGACIGKILSDGGLKVLIVDDKKFPRSKPCGELVTQKSANLIKNTFGYNLENSIYSAHSCDSAIYYKTKKLSCSKSKYMTHYVDRKKFDLKLIESSISAGCSFRDNCKVVKLYPSDNTIVFKGGEKISSSIIIGADGAFSITAKTLFGKIKKYKKNTAIGFSAKIPIEEIKKEYFDKSFIERPNIFFGFANWGYGWVFPNENYVNVGLAGKISVNSKIKETYVLFLKSLRVDTKNIAAAKAHIIPFGSKRIRLGKNNIVLIGDAAGFVEPVTGEGIYYALESAKLCAEAILKNKDFKKLYADYKLLCKGKIIKHLYQGYAARYLLYSSILQPLAMRKLSKGEKWSKGFTDILSGETDYLGYFKKIFTG